MMVVTTSTGGSGACRARNDADLMLNSFDALRPVRDRPRELLIRSDRTAAQDVLVAVHDTGIGLDPQLLERSFEPLFTTKATGMGIGLATSRMIIRVHGGRLWVERNPDHGLTVQLSLPPAGEHAEA
jgi:signal transduction histidine kinase